MIDEKKLKKILISKGKYRLRLSTVIYEIERMEKFDTGLIVNWRLAEDPPEDDNYILLSFANFSVPLVGRYEEDEEGGAYYVSYGAKPCTASDLYVNA